ncbi:ABC transporter [[Clostridium] cellulosi]|uniref:ABC transporter n=1 Tax=[Clostridium] cellulosi TaxID=29343 RepID=A0A078KIC8_9FIRM|nr:ABC transporter [[Clostridium] cellulosi]
MKRFITFLFNYIKKYHALEIAGLFFTLLYTVAVFLAPYASQYLIDKVLIAQSYRKLYIGIFIFFLVCIAQPITGFIKNQIFLNISESISLETRKKLFSKIIKSPLTFFDETKKGSIVSRIVNDGRQLSDFVTNIFVVIVKNVLLIALILIGMFIMSPIVTLIVIIFFASYFGINLIVSKKFEKLSSASVKQFDQFCTNIDQSVNNINIIKTYLLEKKTEQHYTELLKNIYNNNKKIGTLGNILDSVSNAIVIISLSFIYGFGAIMVMHHQLTLGTVVALGLYFQTLVQPISELLNNNMKIHEILPIVQRIEEYINLPEEQNVMSPSPNLANETRIDIDNLSFHYVKNGRIINVFDNLNLNITGNGLYGIVGKSGSGKSTIAKLLLGLYNPQKGNISINVGQKHLSTNRDIRNNISYVQQDAEFLNTSIRQNLLLGNPNATEEEIVDICKRLNLHDKIMALPHGYDDVINEKINLSGGEKQRLSIARAYLKHSPINIFDEVTSSLDKTCETGVLEIIKELATNSVVILITHKTQSLLDAKKIFVIQQGHVAQQGTHNELIAQKGIYQDLFQSDLIQEGHLKYETYF